MKFKQLREKFLAYYKAPYPGSTAEELLINPSVRELSKMRSKELGIIITYTGDAVIFDGMKLLHREVLNYTDDLGGGVCLLRGTWESGEIVDIELTSDYHNRSERMEALGYAKKSSWLLRYSSIDALTVDGRDLIVEEFHKYLKIGGSVTEILKNPTPYEIKKALNPDRNISDGGLIDLKLVSDGKDVYIWDGWTTSHNDIAANLNSTIIIQAEFMYDLRKRSVEELFSVIFYNHRSNKTREEQYDHVTNMIENLGFKISPNALMESNVSEIKDYILDHPDQNIIDITHYNIKRSSENYHTVIQDIEDNLRGMGYRVVDFNGETLEIHKK